MNTLLISKVRKLTETQKFSKTVTTKIMGIDYKPHDDFNALTRIEPVFVDNMVSMTATLAKYKDTDERTRMLLFYYLPVHHLLAIDTRKDGATKILLGPFVPKFMFAMKKAHNIKYNEWDKEDPLQKVALGRTLEHLLHLKPNVKWDVDLRNEFVKEIGGKQNSTIKFAENNEYVSKFEELWGIPTVPFKGVGFQSAVPFIILQLWSAACDKRVPGNMILDPYNWQDLPDCYDYDSIPKTNGSSPLNDHKDVDDLL